MRLENLKLKTVGKQKIKWVGLVPSNLFDLGTHWGEQRL